MLPIGMKIRSTYDCNLEGPIVGYGVIHWPGGPDRPSDPIGEPKGVYLIQVSKGNSSFVQACRVVQMDHAIDATLLEQEADRLGGNHPDIWKERQDRVKRMDKISDSHDLPVCMTDNCELCGEYYNLLQKTYEDFNPEDRKL